MKMTREQLSEYKRWLQSQPEVDVEQIAEPALPHPYGFDATEVDEWTGRLWGPSGTNTGPEIRHAVPHCERWWNRTGRHLTSGMVQGSEHIKSGILRGLPWDELDRGECCVVLFRWWENIGLPAMLEGVNSEITRFILDELAQPVRYKGRMVRGKAERAG